jgi:hypothetical protein
VEKTARLVAGSIFVIDGDVVGAVGAGPAEIAGVVEDRVDDQLAASVVVAGLERHRSVGLDDVHNRHGPGSTCLLVGEGCGEPHGLARSQIQYQVAVGVDGGSPRSLQTETDRRRVRPGMDDEVVLQPALVAVVDDVDPGIGVAVLDAPVVDHVGEPARRIVAEEVVAAPGQWIHPDVVGVGIGAVEMDSEGVPLRRPAHRHRGVAPAEEDAIPRAPGEVVHPPVGLAEVAFEAQRDSGPLDGHPRRRGQRRVGDRRGLVGRTGAGAVMDVGVGGRSLGFTGRVAGRLHARGDPAGALISRRHDPAERGLAGRRRNTVVGDHQHHRVRRADDGAVGDGARDGTAHGVDRQAGRQPDRRPPQLVGRDVAVRRLEVEANGAALRSGGRCRRDHLRRLVRLGDDHLDLLSRLEFAIVGDNDHRHRAGSVALGRRPGEGPARRVEGGAVGKRAAGLGFQRVGHLVVVGIDGDRHELGGAALGDDHRIDRHEDRGPVGRQCGVADWGGGHHHRLRAGVRGVGRRRRRGEDQDLGDHEREGGDRRHRPVQQAQLVGAAITVPTQGSEARHGPPLQVATARTTADASHI